MRLGWSSVEPIRSTIKYQGTLLEFTQCLSLHHLHETKCATLS